MWRLWLALALLVAGGAMLALASVSPAWYAPTHGDETAHFGLLGFEVCDDDACVDLPYDPETVPLEEREKFQRFQWAGRIAYGLGLGAAALGFLAIVFAALGRESWLDRHLGGWTAFLAAWAGLAFCSWKPSGLVGHSARWPLYVSFAAVALIALGEFISSEAAAHRRRLRDAAP